MRQSQQVEQMSREILVQTILERPLPKTAVRVKSDGTHVRVTVPGSYPVDNRNTRRAAARRQRMVS